MNIRLRIALYILLTGVLNVSVMPTVNGHAQGVTCTNNATCIATEYCQKSEGTCAGDGVCAMRPDVCTTEVDPACGCDGTTYNNACEAAVAGVSVLHLGACLRIAFEPANQTIVIGQTATVNIFVSGLAADSVKEIIGAFDLDVGYDSTIVQATTVAFGSELEDATGASLQDADLSTAGVVDFAEVSLVHDVKLDVSQGDSVQLATLSFTGVSPGTSPLTFLFDHLNDVKGLEALMLFPTVLNGSIAVVPPCPTCLGTEIVIDTAIELDANDLPGTAGMLAPFATFDGETILIDLGGQPLRITPNGRLSVLAGQNRQPDHFHRAGNHGTPNLSIVSTCDVVVEESVRGTRLTKFRNLTGVIETNASGGKAGDISIEVEGKILVNGGIQSFQERLPDDPLSLSGAITLHSTCDAVQAGPSSWIVTWGDLGSGAVTLETDLGDIQINGVVMNRTNQAIEGNASPIINVVSRTGDVIINGSNLVLDEWLLMGGRYDVTSGLVVISREPQYVGQINVQAAQNIEVHRDVSGLDLNRQNFAAVATIVNSNSPKGGRIRVRALQGEIRARGRAFQADGRGDNAEARIELIADGGVHLESPAQADESHQPTLTTAARPVNRVARGGRNIVQSCDGNVVINPNAEVLATGDSEPGHNEIMAEKGTLSVSGRIEPTHISRPGCDNPDPVL